MPEETTAREGIAYRIRRWTDADHIFKQIFVEDPVAGDAEYIERVAKLTAAEFRFMFELCDLTLEQMYGDYRLSPFDVGSLRD